MINELRLRIEDDTRRIAALVKSRNEALQEWAEAAAEHRVGQQVELTGYPHSGKRGEITAVNGRLDYAGQPRIEYKYAVVNKAGLPSKVVNSFYTSGRTE